MRALRNEIQERIGITRVPTRYLHYNRNPDVYDFDICEYTGRSSNCGDGKCDGLKDKRTYKQRRVNNVREVAFMSLNPAILDYFVDELKRREVEGFGNAPERGTLSARGICDSAQPIVHSGAISIARRPLLNRATKCRALAVPMVAGASRGVQSIGGSSFMGEACLRLSPWHYGETLTSDLPASCARARARADLRIVARGETILMSFTAGVIPRY